MKKEKCKLTKNDFVLSVLSLKEGAEYKPVQVQKLFFLIDKKLEDQFNEPYFNFRPFDYGPFDKEVYQSLERLSKSGLVEIINTGNEGRRIYRLTSKGKEEGNRLSAQLSEETSKRIKILQDFVLSLSFSQLVSAIYHAFPEMAVNSVFSK